MSIDKKFNEKFKQLLEEGKAVFKQYGWNGKEWHRHPDDIAYSRFRTEVQNLLRHCCGENSDHYREILRISNDAASKFNSYYFKECYGILEAAKKDYDHGLLSNVRYMVRAEVIGDYIEQAKHLMEKGYIAPAASLAGAILEDALRKICEKNSIEIPDKTKIDSLNTALAKRQIYTLLYQKRITAIADIRNNADHGHFNKFKQEDVEDMIQWITRFVADYLG